MKRVPCLRNTFFDIEKAFYLKRFLYILNSVEKLEGQNHERKDNGYDAKIF